MCTNNILELRVEFILELSSRTVAGNFVIIGGEIHMGFQKVFQVFKLLDGRAQRDSQAKSKTCTLS